jgi:hypothetical protein
VPEQFRFARTTSIGRALIALLPKPTDQVNSCESFMVSSKAIGGPGPTPRAAKALAGHNSTSLTAKAASADGFNPICITS